MNLVVAFVAGSLLGMLYAAGKPHPLTSLWRDVKRACRWIRSVYGRLRTRYCTGG